VVAIPGYRGRSADDFLVHAEPILRRVACRVRPNRRFDLDDLMQEARVESWREWQRRGDEFNDYRVREHVGNRLRRWVRFPRSAPPALLGESDELVPFEWPESRGAEASVSVLMEAVAHNPRWGEVLAAYLEFPDSPWSTIAEALGVTTKATQSRFLAAAAFLRTLFPEGPPCSLSRP
jgi:DNA-directed RNA polymerase specialized sigma24 family protein